VIDVIKRACTGGSAVWIHPPCAGVLPGNAAQEKQSHTNKKRVFLKPEFVVPPEIEYDFQFRIKTTRLLLFVLIAIPGPSPIQPSGIYRHPVISREKII
jgi:hypothetical protein